MVIICCNCTHWLADVIEKENSRRSGQDLFILIVISVMYFGINSDFGITKIDYYTLLAKLNWRQKVNLWERAKEDVLLEKNFIFPMITSVIKR